VVPTADGILGVILGWKSLGVVFWGERQGEEGFKWLEFALLGLRGLVALRVRVLIHAQVPA
jgi:hypothetical protein